MQHHSSPTDTASSSPEARLGRLPRNAVATSLARVLLIRSFMATLPEFDIVLWGATGFVGRRVAHHLAQRMVDGAQLRLALGGREKGALEALRARLPAKPISLVLGDSLDKRSLEAIVARTRLVCSTVGPYAKYGTALVEACAQSGTDYCDISGETHWMRQMIDAHQAAAERSGARLIQVCGFDSIPSDLGVFVLQREAVERTGKPCGRVRMRVQSMRGGLNGGTAASFLYRDEQKARSSAIQQIMTDPYGLNPPGERHGPDPPTSFRANAVLDEGLAAWTMPFVMAPINTKMVRRSNALLGYPYGREFRYEEAILTGGGVRGRIAASLGALATGAFMGALGLRSTRSLLTNVLPKPGQGPSDETRRTGRYELLFVGELADGADLRLRVRGDGDPNTESTSKLLAEATLCLAQDDIDVGGGFWTPASALGEALVNRVIENDVLRIERVDGAGGVVRTKDAA